MLASQPGAAIVNCHGSLCEIVGGAVSFGCNSSVPAAKQPATPNIAAEKENNFTLTRGIL